MKRLALLLLLLPTFALAQSVTGTLTIPDASALKGAKGDTGVAGPAGVPGPAGASATITFANGTCSSGAISWPCSNGTVTPPAPVNCVVSGFTQGPLVPATCPASGVQTRTDSRTILTPPANGGTACPALTQTTNVPCTPPVAGACVGAANTPGGSDGVGGCFPGSQNTGVPAGVTLTAYTGPCTIGTAGLTIDSKLITCNELTINAAGVTVSKSEVRGQITINEGSSASLTIADSFVNAAAIGYIYRSAIESDNITVLRSHVIGGIRGIYCRRNCTVRDSWIHGQMIQAASDWHLGGIRLEQGATLVHNTIHCEPKPTSVDGGCSADITGYPDFDPLHHNTLDGNLFMANTGIAYCMYAGGTKGKPFSNDVTNATYIVIKNNVWQRGSNGKCGAFGPVTDFVSGRTGSVWLNNKWDDGTMVPPG